jgi:hypothetical protein
MVSTEFTHAPCRHKHGPYSPLTSERAYEASHTGAGAADERRPAQFGEVPAGSAAPVRTSEQPDAPR